MYNGLRYSLDYSITQMTFKFFVFDHLMNLQWSQDNKLGVYMGCGLTNLVATIASQSAFNYQTLASSG